MTARTVGITGASGFVGTAIANAFAEGGWKAIAMGRRPPSGNTPAQEYRLYDLARPIPDSLFAGLDAIVHAAYDSAGEVGPNPLNVAATQKLIEAARASGVGNFTFISSLAADPESTSSYGRSKYRIETMLDERRDVIVRPGLVAGGGGLYGAIRSVIRKFRLAPIFDGGRQPVYVVDVRELAGAVARLVAARAHGTYLCAATEPLEMAQLYAEIAAAGGVGLRRIPLPLGPAVTFAAVFERCGVRLPVSAESLRGIANLRRMEMSHADVVGITFTPAREVIRSAEAALA